MTWPPAASIRAAAAITSITMNGGTSLRPEAVSRLLARSVGVASCIDICYFSPCPRLAAFHGLLGHISYPIRRQSLKIAHRSFMSLRPASHKKTSKLTAVATAAALALAPMASARAQEKGPPTIRDTEAEQLLRDYTRPILRAAGLEKQNIQIVIINDPTFNAFVADGRRIFVNFGAIMQSETPNQLIGVLAHETGHLAGGHLAKMREQLAQAQTQMIIAMLLGAGALVAGARSGNSNNGLANAGAATIAGPQEMIRRNLISYQRQQEENADRAGVKFLNATGQSAKGMYDTFKRFANDSLFAGHGADPYLQSHPMPIERVAALEELARSSPYWDKKDDPALQMRHDMVRAKISAFMERQDTVYRRYPMANDSLPARYAHAITTYLHGDLRSALTQIDGLIQLQPNNPYFQELRGQALLEGGKPLEAIVPLRKAVALSNNAPLIEMLLGQALVGTDNKAYTEEAIRILRAAVTRETEAPLGYSQLAMAYGRKGDYAEADLASAQAAFLRGDNKTARQLAARAKTRFAVGTPGWVKADDIVTAKPIPGQTSN